MIAHGKDIKVFTGNSNPKLAQNICQELGIPLGDSEVGAFSDGENFASIYETVRGSDVFVVQSTCSFRKDDKSGSVNDALMELLIMIDALRRASAGRITAVIPYFGYARQDRKTKPRDPISAKLVANLIAEAGADRVLTMDLLRGDMAGMPANDHYQLRLILYLPGQGAGIEDLLPMGGQAAGRLKEDVWVGGNGGVELLGVIPVVEAHRQHLAGRAGGQELQTVQEKTLSGLLPPAKQVTGQGVDHVVLHAAIGGAVRPQKTDEFCHLALPPALRMKDASCF